MNPFHKDRKSLVVFIMKKTVNLSSRQRKVYIYEAVKDMKVADV